MLSHNTKDTPPSIVLSLTRTASLETKPTHTYTDLRTRPKLPVHSTDIDLVRNSIALEQELVYLFIYLCIIYLFMYYLFIYLFIYLLIN